MDQLQKAFRAGDWLTLLSLCEQKAASSEDSPSIAFLNVYALIELGRLDAAIAALSADSQIPEDRRASAYRRVATALVETDRALEAVSLYRLAATALPTDATSRILLGALLRDLGQLDDAVMALREATDCADGHPEEAWLNLSGIHAERGEVAQAETCLLRALAIAPGYQDAIDALSRVRTGEFGDSGT